MIALPDDGQSRNLRSAEARLDEAEGLAEAIGIDVVGRRAFRLRDPRPATLFGKGQAEAIAEMVESHEAGLLIVDAALSPVQQKSLEEITKAKVIDRAGLILEIQPTFSRHQAGVYCLSTTSWMKLSTMRRAIA